MSTGVPNTVVVPRSDSVPAGVASRSGTTTAASLTSACTSAGAGQARSSSASAAKFAPALHGLLGLPAALLLIAGAAPLSYAAYLVWLATRPRVPRAAVWVPIVLNLVWAAECGLVRFGRGAQPTALGDAFIAPQVVTVLVFVELEFAGLRRACAIVPA